MNRAKETHLANAIIETPRRKRGDGGRLSPQAKPDHEKEFLQSRLKSRTLGKVRRR